MEAINKLRPVRFESLCKADLEKRPGWSYYGFVAEEVAEIDPRLAQWGLEPLDTFDANGIPQLGKESVPIGIAYDRISALMIAAYGKKFAEIEKRIKVLENN